MSGTTKITRTSVSVEILKQINTNCNLFDAVIYLLSDRSNIMVEIPRTGEIYEIPGYKIGEYIKVKKVKTNWIKHIDGSFSKFDEDKHYHLIPLNNEFGFYQIAHEKQLNIRNYRFIRPYNSENFKLIKKINERDLFTVAFKAVIPIWPLWAMVDRNITLNNQTEEKFSSYRLSKLFMKIDDVFYRFPYGNVNGSDKVCTGNTNKSYFKSPEDIWYNWITTVFNFDYKHNIKPNNMFYSKNKHKSNSKLIPVTYDLEHISLMLEADNYDQLSIFDAMFFLSNVEEAKNIDYSKIFFKHPGVPEKVEDET